MRRLFKALLVLMTVTLLAGSAFGGGKDLGDLLAKNNGSYGAYYDQRLWPQPFFDVQYPNGGVRLYLTLGVFSTAAERDAATALIKEVVFENVSGGIAYALTKPELYTQDDKAGLMGGGITYGVDYYVWVGNYHQAQGEYEVTVKSRNGKYEGSFVVGYEALLQRAILPVDASGITVSQNQVTAVLPTPPRRAGNYIHPGPTEDYRLRFMTHTTQDTSSSLLVFFERPNTYDPETKTATWNIYGHDFSDGYFRIEARRPSDLWPGFGMGRTNTFFRILD